MGEYIPFTLPPGMYRNGTRLQARGRWAEGSLVRFYEGTIRPVGGWGQVNQAPLTGRISALLSWKPISLAIARYLAIGTTSKLYAYDNATIFDITPVGLQIGRESSTEGVGYGGALYGRSAYGTPRAAVGRVLEAGTWTLDTYGDSLIACATFDGRIYRWNLNTAQAAAPLANAPINNTGCFTSDEGFLVAFGADSDPRRVQWSDQDNITTWAPAATNQAGSIQLRTQSRIRSAIKVRGGALLLTDSDAHLMRYLGPPFVYGADRVGTNCGIIGPNAGVATSDAAVWLGESGFFVYNGYVQPLQCDVLDYLLNDLNRVQRAKVTAQHIGEFGEVWFYYASSNSQENDKYVTWNYRENHWATGSLSRTAAIDRGTFTYPLAADAQGFWYEQEKGFLANGLPRSGVYLQSGPSEVGKGDFTHSVQKIIHDDSDSANRLAVTFIAKYTPEGAPFSFGPYNLSASNGYTDVRVSGRQLELRFEQVTDGDWRLGVNRMYTASKSKR